MSISCSGSTSRTLSQVVSTRRLALRPSSSQPPARRTCSGTQWPDANGGSSHSRHTTRRGGMPLSRRSSTRFSIARQALAQQLDQADRLVLRLGHRADGRDRVEDALDGRRLEADDRSSSVEPAHGLGHLAVADRADRRTAPGSGSGRAGPRPGRRGRACRSSCRRGSSAATRSLISRLSASAVAADVGGDDRHRRGLGRVVALVRPADELVAQAEREHDLGGRRQQGDDAHRHRSIGRPAVAPAWRVSNRPDRDWQRPSCPGQSDARTPSVVGRRRLEALRLDRRRARPLVRRPPRRAPRLPRAQRRRQDHDDAHDPRHHPARSRRDPRLRQRARRRAPAPRRLPARGPRPVPRRAGRRDAHLLRRAARPVRWRARGAGARSC